MLVLILLVLTSNILLKKSMIINLELRGDDDGAAGAWPGAWARAGTLDTGHWWQALSGHWDGACAWWYDLSCGSGYSGLHMTSLWGASFEKFPIRFHI